MLMFNPGYQDYAAQDRPTTSKPLQMIVFGEDWGAHPSSTQHIMKHLVDEHEIVWVNSIGLRRPKFNAHDFKRAQNKLMNMMRGQRVCDDHIAQNELEILQPRAISWPGNPFAGLFNRLSVGLQIDDAIARKGFDTPILWTSLPSAIDVIDRYEDHQVVYYCGDDFNALAGVDHKPVARQEERLAARADLIIVASKTLLGKFPAEKTILIEHGVNFTMFSKNAPRAKDLPDAPKIAGFYGSIHEWIDQELLIKAAQSCPDWQFVFVGKTHVDTSALAALKNTHFLGAKAHDELPSYAQHWDVSLLPFKDCEQIRACNPLKLREYLSAGKPVISSTFPALAAHKDKVYCMQGGEDLVQILRQIECLPVPRRPDLAMKQEDWAYKAKMIEKAIKSI